MNGLLGIVILVLDIIAIINIVQSGMSTGKKVIWALVVILIPIIGMVAWFLIGKKSA